MLKSFWGLFSLFKFFLNFAGPVLKVCVLVKRSHIIIISSDERIVPVVLCYTIALEGVLSNVLWNSSVRASLSYEWQILVLFFFSVSLLGKVLLISCSSVSNSYPFLPSHITSSLSRRSKRHLGTPDKMPQTSFPLGEELVVRYFCYILILWFVLVNRRLFWGFHRRGGDFGHHHVLYIAWRDFLYHGIVLSMVLRKMITEIII